METKTETVIKLPLTLARDAMSALSPDQHMITLPAEIACWLLSQIDDERYPKLYGELEFWVTE